MIPYGHQHIDEDDIQAVVKVLRGDWLTQGPKVEEFERALADYCGARFAVVASNGTAALHAAYAAAGLSEGDEMITSPMTFAATSNAALMLGAKPIFVDIEEDTGNIDPGLIEEKITSRTKVIAPIDYTGRPVDLDYIQGLAKKYNLIVIEDACHAIGAKYHGKKIGSISDLTVLSFHPVKNITTGEGGAVLTNNKNYYERMKRFVSHGLTKEGLVRVSPGEWYHEMQVLGNNYRLTDMQCALGISQLKKIEFFLERRREIAQIYQRAFKNHQSVILPCVDSEISLSAWHLYVIRLSGSFATKRSQIFSQLRNAGIGVQVHYIPVYWHPYYQGLGYTQGLCPKAEAWYEAAISLPMYPDLTKVEQEKVVAEVIRVATN